MTDKLTEEEKREIREAVCGQEDRIPASKSESDIGLLAPPSKYNLDLDYQLPMIDISQKELENIVAEADSIIAENNGDSQKLATAYLKKAQAMQKIQECISDETSTDTQYQIKALLDKVLELSPDMPEALMQMGKVYAVLERLGLSPKNGETYFDEAIKWYTKAIELKPDYAPAYNNRGNVYSVARKVVPLSMLQKRGNIFHSEKSDVIISNFDCMKKAIADYTEAIQIRPFSAIYYLNRGHDYKRWGEHEKAIADFTNVITYGSDNFKKDTGIFYLRGIEYLKMNDKKKAQNDFKEYFNKGGKLEGDPCFLCDDSLGYPIGSNGLMICSSCLKKIDTKIASIFSISKEDIKKCKQEKRLKEMIRLPKIYTRTISKNKKIKCYELMENDDTESTSDIRKMIDNLKLDKFLCNKPATETPKDGIANHRLAEDKACFVCKRNCYVTDALFMIRNNLWICPDCLKYIDINDENVSPLSITNEEIVECKTYLDTNTLEGKETQSILSESHNIRISDIRIISWNCYCGFTEDKAAAIKPYNASILVIPECREMDMEASGYDAQHRYWYGDHKEATDEHGNIDKEKDLGIGVFWKDGITVTPLSQWENTLCKNDDFRYFIPFKVQWGYYAKPFTLIAVWTKDKKPALDHYARMGLLDDRVVIIGDFYRDAGLEPEDPNDLSDLGDLSLGTFFDLVDVRPNCGGNSFDLNTPKGMTAMADWLLDTEQGTYCYYINGKEKHIFADYCYASKDMINGAYFSDLDTNDWQEENGKKHWNGSDHFPICVEIDLFV